ncbi:hypothetical protein [Paraburkholderia azotifigens]|uniref:MORN repeat-containing protein n=1 Tax=Paraburkholderia azotifigens TaxID=2057004 RepID=A0A5C6VLU4_9BURK|nr:hypothetical protein [Paraburkholderia azotifigens]TXC84505.1 hypothetical protein FRZ40_29995 [Paraburkholderia azotifigens]
MWMLMLRSGKISRIDGQRGVKLLFLFWLACSSLVASAAGESQVSATADATPDCRLIDSQDWPSHQYQGPCLKGLSDGAGVVRFANGDELRGQFKQGQLVGDKGEIHYANGDRYAGGIKAGLPDGEGIYTWRNGDTYKGLFESGKKVGTGQYTEAQSGRQFQARYQNDFLQELNQASTSALATPAQEDNTLPEAFRRTLKPGDQTNLGLVIEIKRKDGLVLVQAEETGLFGIPRYNYQQQRSGVDYALAPQVAQRWVKLSEIFPPTSRVRPEQNSMPYR